MNIDDNLFYQDIAHQLVHNFPGNNLTLIFGGGRSQFEPCTNRTSSSSYCRSDNRNLTEEWLQKDGSIANRVLLTDRQDLANLMKKNTGKSNQILGLFADDHLDLVLDRLPTSMQPTLPELVEAAVKILSQNDNGFFLFVEGSNNPY